MAEKGKLRTRVHVDRLPPCCRVDANDGMNGFHWLSADGVASGTRAISLRDGTVDGIEGFEVFLEEGAEGRIQRVASEGCERLFGTSDQERRRRTYPEDQSVSPPYGGPSITLREVYEGGWIS